MSLDSQKIDKEIEKYNLKIDETADILLNLEADRDKLIALKNLGVDDLLRRLTAIEKPKFMKLIPRGYSEACVNAALSLINGRGKPISTAEIVNHVYKTFDFGPNLAKIDDKRRTNTAKAALKSSDKIESVGDGSGNWRLKISNAPRPVGRPKKLTLQGEAHA